MTDHGDYIQVDAGEAGLTDLLKTVREQGRSVRIFEGGTPVAELSPLPRPHGLPPVDPRLAATMLVEGDELATEADWPEHLR